MKFQISLLAAFIISLSVSAQTYLPAELGDRLLFGQNQDSFQKLRPNAKVEPNVMFKDVRTIFKEGGLSKDIVGVTYYCDANNDHALYEVIIEFSDKATCKKRAIEVLGGPNHENDQWRISETHAPKLWGYIFEKKLIVIAMLPGTEHFDQNW